MIDKKEFESHEGHGKNVLELTVNGKKYKWPQQYITGAEIRKLGGIAINHEIFLAIKRPWEDEAIYDDKQVNLARPEIEHFYSKEKCVDVVIIVNGRERPWKESKISFAQVINLAFGNYVENGTTIYTVTFKRGPKENPEGSLVKGKSVFVQNKMIFNATETNKS